jgi:phosphate:Na+ symporter
MTAVLDLLAGIALLVFATRMVKTAVMRGFGGRLREALAHATAGPLRASATGLGLATALQSASATAVLAASFADRGFLALAAGLALMLGADVGSTVAVQILSLKPVWLGPVLIAAGVPVFVAATRPAVRQLGRVALGVGLVVLALGMIAAASAPLRDAAALQALLVGAAAQPVLAFGIGLALAVVAQSSLAAVLTAMAFAASGAAPLPVVLAVVLGANVGSALVPFVLAPRTGTQGRRLLIGNLAFRGLGAAAALAVLSQAGPPLAWLGADAARAVANAHTLFNLTLALVFLPLAGPAAALLARLVREPPVLATVPPVDALSEAPADGDPDVALAAAARETMRLADTVEVMLRESIEALADPDERRREAVRRLDDAIDRRYEEIKLFLIRLERGRLDEAQARRAMALISHATNLEHAGDIIDKGLMRLAARRHRRGLAIPEADWAEIRALHERALGQMRLSGGLLVAEDPAVATALVREKDAFREAERIATERHLRRLRAEPPAGVEASALHLDILRDLKRIVAHLTAVAYPVLEARGGLRDTRLVEPLPDAPGSEVVA